MRHSTSRLLLLGCVLVAMAGCATAPPAETADQRNCIRETGTRVPVPEGRCSSAAGNVYSQKDLQRTGATTVGEALRRMGH